MGRLLLRALFGVSLLLLGGGYLLSTEVFSVVAAPRIGAWLAPRLDAEVAVGGVRFNLLRLRLVVDDLSLAREGVGKVRVEELVADLAAAPLLHRHLRLDRLRLHRPTLSCADPAALAALIPQSPAGSPPAAVEVTGGEAALFFGDTFALLLAGIEAQARIRGGHAAVDLKVGALRATVDGRPMPAVAVATTAEGGAEGVRLSHLVVASHGSHLTGGGRWAGGEATWRLAGSVDLAEAATIVPQAAPLAGTLHLQLTGSGSLADPHVAGRVGLAEVHRGGVELQQAVAAIDGDRHGVRLTDIDGVVEEARVTGRATIAPGVADGELTVADLTWANLRAASARWGNPLPDLPLQMSATLSGRFDYRRDRGTTVAGTASGSIAGLGLSEAEAAGHPGAILNRLAPAAVTVAFARPPAGPLTLRDGIVRMATGEGRVSGTIGAHAALDLDVAIALAESLDLAQLLGISLHGETWGQGRVTGLGAGWRFDGPIGGEGIAIEGENLARFTGCLHLDGEGGGVGEMEGWPAAGGPPVRGELVAGDDGVDLRLSSKGIDFAAIRYLDRWPYLAGHGDVEFRLRTPAPVRIEVRGYLPTVSAWGIDLAPMELTVNGVDGGVRWQARAAGTTLIGDGAVAADGSATGAGRFDHLDLGRLHGALPPRLAALGVGGEATGTFRVGGLIEPAEALRVEVELDGLKAHAAGTTLVATDTPARVAWQEGGLHLHDLVVAGDGLGGTIDGWFNPGGPLAIAVQADVDLAALAQRGARLAGVEGSLSVYAEVAGNTALPEISGGAVLREASAPVPGLDLRLEGVAAEGIFSGQHLLIDSLHGRLGDGTVEGNGFVRLGPTGVDHLVLDTRLAGVGVDIAGAKAMVEGDLALRGPPAALVVGGDLVVRRLRYTKGFNATTLARRVGPPAAGGATFDLRLRAPQTVEIDNDLLDLMLGGEVTLLGPVAAPGVVGSLTGSNGTLHLRDRDIHLTSVSVTFVDPEGIEPLIDVQGETVLRDFTAAPFGTTTTTTTTVGRAPRNYHVILTASGPVDALVLQASSTPPLDESVLLAAVAGGSVGGAVGEEASERLLSMVTHGLRRGLGAGGEFLGTPLERLLTLDRIDFDPFAVSQSNVVSPRLTLGKDLADRLSLIYSTSFVANEEPVIELRYHLSPAWEARGGKNEIGSVGGDLRYEFRF